MSGGYPLLLRVADRAVLVVGGGAVATRRAQGLVAAGARLVVVAPVVIERLRGLAAEVRQREFRADDLDGVMLVLACTDVPKVNAAVHAAASGRGLWCLRADDAAVSDAWVPAVHRTGDTVVAVSAGGAPARARALRDRIAALLDAPGGVVVAGWSAVRTPHGGADAMSVADARALAGASVVHLDRSRARAALAHARADVTVVDGDPDAPGVREAVLAAVAAGERVVVVVDDPDVLARHWA